VCPELADVKMAMFEYRDRTYAEVGVPPEEPEDALDRWRRMKAEREGERKLDTPQLTLHDTGRAVRSPGAMNNIIQELPTASIMCPCK
jgi:hypothetical protein